MPFYILLADDPDGEYGPFATQEQARLVAEGEGHTSYQIAFRREESSTTEPVSTGYTRPPQ